MISKWHITHFTLKTNIHLPIPTSWHLKVNISFRAKRMICPLLITILGKSGYTLVMELRPPIIPRGQLTAALSDGASSTLAHMLYCTSNYNPQWGLLI